MASLGLWTLPFCSLAYISPTVDFVNLQSGSNLSDVFVVLHRFPSSHAPVFLGWHLNGGSYSPSSGDPYNSEKAGASCWSPRAWHTDSNFGLRAEDTALRSFAPRDSGRPIRVRKRREVRFAGLSPLPVALQLCRGADPSLNTRPARSALSQHAVTLPALRFASHSIAPQTASACSGTTSASFFLVLHTSLEVCPRAGILELRRNNHQPRHPILPFCCGPRTACKFAARVAPFFAGHNRITGAGT